MAPRSLFRWFVLTALLWGSAAAADPADPWWADAWPFRVPLTVSGAGVAEATVEGQERDAFASCLAATAKAKRFGTSLEGLSITTVLEPLPGRRNGVAVAAASPRPLVPARRGSDEPVAAEGEPWRLTTYQPEGSTKTLNPNIVIPGPPLRGIFSPSATSMT